MGQITLLLLLLFASLCFGSSVKNLVVFGDSYSDVGNFRRMSNGPLWSEYLAVSWEASIKSFAFAGAVCDNDMGESDQDGPSIPSIKDQIEMYYTEDMKLSPSDTVYAIWVGLRDIQQGIKDETPTYYWRDVAQCIRQQIRNLYAVFDARRILILNLPSLDTVPYFDRMDLQELMSAADDLNLLVNEEVAPLVNSHPNIKLAQVDVNSLVKSVVDDPQAFDMEQAEKPFWEVCQGRCEDDIDAYVWWDQVHMTSGMHRLVANTILNSGLLEPSTSITASPIEVSSIIQENPSYQSPKYKPKSNTGVIDELAKEAIEIEQEATKDLQENETPVQDEAENDNSGLIYFGFFVMAALCLLFFLKLRGRHMGIGSLASLSSLLKSGKHHDSSSRGQFIPLRNAPADV